jgi:hypothetical protein
METVLFIVMLKCAQVKTILPLRLEIAAGEYRFRIDG